jgi:hypothetical protein
MQKGWPVSRRCAPMLDLFHRVSDGRSTYDLLDLNKLHAEERFSRNEHNRFQRHEYNWPRNHFWIDTGSCLRAIDSSRRSIHRLAAN